MQVRKQQLGLDIEKQIGFKLGKEYFKDIYCHSAYLMLSRMKYKLESRLLGDISIASVIQMTSPLWKKVKRN